MEDTVRKSKNHVREYRVIELKNGLQALIVHDPKVVVEGDNKKESMQMERVSYIIMSVLMIV